MKFHKGQTVQLTRLIDCRPNGNCVMPTGTKATILRVHRGEPQEVRVNIEGFGHHTVYAKDIQ